MKYFFTIFLLVSILLVSARIIDDLEIDLIEQMLQKEDLTLEALKFEKDWSGDTELKLPIVKTVLENPLAFPKLLEDIDAMLSGSAPETYLPEIAELIYSSENIWTKTISAPQKSTNWQEDIAFYLEDIWKKAETHRKKAFELLSKDELNQLTFFALTLWSEAEDSVAYNRYIEANEIIEYQGFELEKDWIPLLRKIDFTEMMIAASLFQSAFTNLTDCLLQNPPEWERRIEMNTSWGKICFGTIADDSYHGRYAAIFDPGGNDTYDIELRADFKSPFYWLIDTSGDDIYRNNDVSSLFTVAGGLGCSFDAAGTDNYFGNDLTLSAIFGYQIHQDLSGGDTYRMGLHSLGAASCGVSILLDESGNS